MKKLLIFFISFIPLMAYANMSCSANGCTGTPEYIISWPAGYVTIYPHGGTANALNGETDCTGTDNGKAIKLSESNGQDKMYSMLLSAMAANKSIFIRTQNNSAECEVVYIRYSE